MVASLHGRRSSSRPCVQGHPRPTCNRSLFPSLDTIFEESWWESVVAPRRPASVEELEHDRTDTLVAMLQDASLSDPADMPHSRSRISEANLLIWPEENARAIQTLTRGTITTRGFETVRFGFTSSMVRRRHIAVLRLPSPVPSQTRVFERIGHSSALVIKKKPIREVNEVRRRPIPHSSMRRLPHVQDEPLQMLFNVSLKPTQEEQERGRPSPKSSMQQSEPHDDSLARLLDASMRFCNGPVTTEG